MSFLDLYQGDQAEAARIQPNEGARLPSTFDENFHAAWSDGRMFGQSVARYNAQGAVIDDYVDEVRSKAGVDLSEDLAPKVGGAPFDYDAINAKVAVAKARNPALDIDPLSDDEIDKRALAKAQAAHRAYETLQAGERTSGGAFGGIVGGIASSAADPINLVGLMVAPETGGVGILGAALRWGGVAAVSQAAIEAGSNSFKEQVQPGYTESGAPIKEIAGAFVGGAVLGGSFKALGNLWTRVKTGNWPTSVRDAGNVIESEANVASTNPFPGVEGEVAHREALTKAIDDIFAGNPVDVSDQLFAHARTNENGEPLDLFAAHEARLDQLMGERAFVRGTAELAKTKADAGLAEAEPELPFEPTALQATAEQHAAQLANGIREIARSRGYDMPGEDATAIAERVAKMPDDQSARAILDEVARNPTQIADHLPEIPKTVRGSDATAPQPPMQTPEQMAKTLTAPEHQDAIRADIDRERAMGDVKVPGIDEQGNHTMVSVDDAMDKVDAYKQLAEHIQACALPAQEAAE